jgi:hypothetical protein
LAASVPNLKNRRKVDQMGAWQEGADVEERLFFGKRLSDIVTSAFAVFVFSAVLAMYVIAFLALAFAASQFGDSYRELGPAVRYAAHRWSERYVPSLGWAEARGFWEGVNFTWIVIAVGWLLLRFAKLIRKGQG